MRTRFWVKRGHALSFERIVEEGDDYAIIEGEATPLRVMT
jgi:hypothetical protein